MKKKFRFRLWQLMFVVTISALVIGVPLRKCRNRQAALNALEKKGGEVKFVESDSTVANVCKLILGNILAKECFEKADFARSDAESLSSAIEIKYFPEIRALYLEETGLSDLREIGKLPNLKQLFLKKTKVKNLLFLQNLPGLEVLAIDNTPTKELAGIEHVSLVALSICGTEIEEFSLLKGQKSLRRFYASDTRFSDLTLLYPSEGLEALELNNGELASLKGIGHFSRLRILEISGTAISDLTPLENLPIEILDIANTRVVDFEPLLKLPKLNHLDLEGTQLGNFEIIARIASLETLNIRKTNVRNIAGLAQLPKLRIVYADKQLTDEEVAQMKSLAPQTKVIRY